MGIGLFRAAVVAVVLASWGTAAAAPPQISFSGSSRDSYVPEDFSTFNPFNLTVTEPDGEDIVSAEITLLNPLDGADEELRVSFTSLTVTPYDSSTGILAISGPATASTFGSTLDRISYDNNAVNPTLLPRFIRIEVSDGMESAFVIGRIDIYTAPDDSQLTILLEDEFNGGSFDTSKFSVTEGSTPTVNGGRLTLAGSSIRTVDTFRGIPLWFEAKGVDWISFDADSASDFSIVSDELPTPVRGNRTTRGSSTSTGDYRSYTSFVGSTILQSLFVDPPFGGNRPIIDDDGDFAILAHHDHVVRYDPPFVSAGSNTTTPGHSADYVFEIRTTPGATLTVDRIRVATLNTLNPAYRFVDPLATGRNLSFGDTGVSMIVDNLESGSQGFSAGRIDSAPPNLPDALPFFWDITDSGSHSTDLTISFDTQAVVDAGLSGAQLAFYRSTDNGNTWETVGGSVSAVSGTGTATNIDEFSIWAVAAAPVPSFATNWNLYQ